VPDRTPRKWRLIIEWSPTLPGLKDLNEVLIPLVHRLRWNEEEDGRQFTVKIERED
jgi:hypothetical protein